MASGNITKYADGNDTGWQEIKDTSASPTFSGTIYWRKIGSMVALDGYGLQLITDLTSTYKILVTSAQSPLKDYPPIARQSFPAGNSAGFGQILIDTGASAGEIMFFKLASEATWPGNRNIHFSGFYMTAT